MSEETGNIKLPTLSEKGNLTLAEAKKEYNFLLDLLEQKTGFPDSGTGWATWYILKIHQRLNFVKSEICRHVTKRKETENGK